MASRLPAGILIGIIIGAAAALGTAALRAPPAPPPAPVAVAAPPFAPRLASAAPADGFGDAVRLGEALMTDTAAHAPRFVGNQLRCANCHLDAGRQAGAAPLWAAFVNFPAFRKKNNEVNSFQKRAQDCFVYSMNGKPPPLGDPVLIAIESYAAFMARGLPSGLSPPGRGFPPLASPPLSGDDARGAAVYAASCASCHGATGAGQVADGKTVYPPLWGARSYNWGAGMAMIDKAAAFIHANMPLGQGVSLSVQQAWDVATFVDGQVRPQDPRFAGTPRATRAAHHDSPFSRYGTMVDGRVLGDPAITPPAGTS